MIRMKLSLVDEKIIIVENKQELEAAKQAGREESVSVWTRTEMKWLALALEDADEETKVSWLEASIEIKKSFGAWFDVPKTFKPLDG